MSAPYPVPFLWIVLATVCAAPAMASEPEIIPTQLTFDRVLVQTTPKGELWARGSTYKASFDGRAMTYYPFLGASAPRSFPVSFTLESATVGSRALALGDACEPRLDENAVIHEHGVVREAFELGIDSVEQTFTFDSLPERGELAVRVAVETELASRIEAEGFRFENDLGAVRYGAATAIDGAGRSLALESRLEDGVLEIRVPAAFVESASLPLVIDPVLSTFVLNADGRPRLVPNATFTGRWFVVHELIFSASDHDIVLQAWNNVSPPTPFATLAIDNTIIDYRNPSIADNNMTDTALVVAQAWIGAWTIMGSTVPHDASTASTPFQISAGGAFSCTLPDVGGCIEATTDAFMVVWTEQVTASDLDVRGRLVNHTGGFITPIFGIGLSFSVVSQRAVISNTARTAWTVAWEQQVFADEPDIAAARYATDGTVLALINVDTGPLETRAPSVAPDLAGTNRWLVAYERADGSDMNIVAALFDNTTKLAELDVSLAEGSITSFRDQRRPDVDCNGKRFTLVYSELAPPSSSDWNVYLDELYVSAGELELAESRVQLSSSTTAEDHAQIMAKRSGTGANLDVRNLVVWDDNALAIEGALYENTIGGRVTRVCPGDLTNAICPCGNIGAVGHGCANSVQSAGGSLAGSGNASLSQDTLVLEGSFMPPGSTCLYFQGTALTGGGFGVTFGDGLRCASGTVIRLATKTNTSGGASSYPATGEEAIALAGAVPNGGATRYYQVWYRNSAAFCTASTFNLTNALETAWSS